MAVERPELELPPAKKRKVDLQNKESKPDTDEPFYPFRLVPSPQEARSLETIDVWVTSTLAAAGAGDLLKFIHARLTPLDIEKGRDLTHLKRVRKSGNKTDEGVEIIDIILCAASTLLEEDIQVFVNIAQASGIKITPRIAKVSRWPAYTKRQLNEFKSLWPVSLRKDTTRTIKNPAKEAAEMRRFMLETIAASKQNQQLHPDDIPITAVLVNPRTSEILLTAHDTRISSRHPLNHSVMLLLNQLPSLLPADTSAAAPETEETGEQYYANSYDVYVTHEPCTMCCMAMVHSRVRRLIFWKGMPTGAGWLGWMKGDEEETLNHRYMCFQGIGGSLNQEMGIGEINGDVCA